MKRSIRTFSIFCCLTLVNCTGSDFEELEEKEQEQSTPETPAPDPSSASTEDTSGSEESPVDDPSQPKVKAPPGSLGVGNDINIEAGVPVANELAASKLDLNGKTTPAGEPVYVSTTKPVDAATTGGFILSTPLYKQDQIAFALSDLDEDQLDKLVVLYKVDKENSDFKYGLIPKSDLTIENNVASFNMKGIGNYQPTILSEKVEEAKEVDSPGKPLSKAQEAELSTGFWVDVAATSQSQDGDLETFQITGTLQDFTPVACTIILDQDAVEPWDKIIGIGSSPTYNFEIDTSKDEEWYARFICESADGARSSLSFWTTSFPL